MSYSIYVNVLPVAGEPKPVLKVEPQRSPTEYLLGENFNLSCEQNATNVALQGNWNGKQV